MLKIESDNSRLLLSYYPHTPCGWLQEKFDNNETYVFERTFKVAKADLAENVYINGDEQKIDFVLGELENEYWHINKNIIGANHEVYLHISSNPKRATFITDTGRSVFSEIFNVIDEDIYVGGGNENAINVGVFSSLIARLPNKKELSHYVSAKISSVLKEYFYTTKDFEHRYEKYIEARRKRLQESMETKPQQTGIRKFYKHNEIDKYQEIKNILIGMLAEPDIYSEKQWQESIIEVLLILYPKYIRVLQNVEVPDQYQKKKRFLDYVFVDANGNCDVVEIKKPFSSCILRNTQYRDNYIPVTELSGSVMQVEKYIFHMNKWGPTGEDKLTQIYNNKLPNGMRIFITNPKGMVILGRSNQFNTAQNADFEIIKRKYSNIIDILSYDDLLARVERILESFQAI